MDDVLEVWRADRRQSAFNEWLIDLQGGYETEWGVVNKNEVDNEWDCNTVWRPGTQTVMRVVSASVRRGWQCEVNPGILVTVTRRGSSRAAKKRA